MRRWRDEMLVVSALLAALGLFRSVLLLSPPSAGDLPETLRNTDPRLVGRQSWREPVMPSVRKRDVSWSPVYRYSLGSSALHLELVVRRSRTWMAMAPERLTEQRLLRLGPRQQVALGRLKGREALRTCLVGRGANESGPSAEITQDELLRAVQRWQARFDEPTDRWRQLKRVLAIQAGLRAPGRWECLQVTLVSEVSHANKQADSKLVAVWQELYPQLFSWGEQWEGVDY